MKTLLINTTMVLGPAQWQGISIAKPISCPFLLLIRWSIVGHWLRKENSGQVPSYKLYLRSGRSDKKRGLNVTLARVGLDWVCKRSWSRIWDVRTLPSTPDHIFGSGPLEKPVPMQHKYWPMHICPPLLVIYLGIYSVNPDNKQQVIMRLHSLDQVLPLWWFWKGNPCQEIILGRNFPF